jgi:hypothetical protein
MLVSLEDIMPLEARYQTDGFTVLCDSKLLFYSSSGILKSEYNYNGEIPVYSLITDNYTFLAFPENVIGDTQRLLIFDSNGTQVAEKHVDGQIVRMQCLGNEIYILTSDSIVNMKINDNTQTAFAIEKNSIDLVTIDENTFFLCYPGYALTVDINSAFSSQNNEQATEEMTQPLTETQTDTSAGEAETAQEP